MTSFFQNYNYFTLAVVFLALLCFSIQSVRKGKWIYLFVHPFMFMCLVMATAFRKPTGIPGMKELTDQMIALGFASFCLAFWLCHRSISEKKLAVFWTRVTGALAPGKNSVLHNNVLFVVTIFLAWAYIVTFWFYGWYCTGDILKSICSGHRAAVPLEMRYQFIPSLIRYPNMLTGYIAPVLIVCYTAFSFRKNSGSYSTHALISLYTTLFFLTTTVGCSGSRTGASNMWVTFLFIVVICLYRRVAFHRLVFLFIPCYLAFVSFFAFALIPHVRQHGVQNLWSIQLTAGGVKELYQKGIGFAVESHKRKATQVRVIIDSPLPGNITESNVAEKRPDAETVVLSDTSIASSPTKVSTAQTDEQASTPLVSKKPFWTFDKETREHSIRLKDGSIAILDEHYIHYCSRATTADCVAWVILFYGSNKEHLGLGHAAYCVATCLIPRTLWSGKPVGIAQHSTADYGRFPLQKALGGGPIFGTFGEGYFYWGFAGGIIYSLLFGCLGALVSKTVVAIFLESDLDILSLAFSLTLYNRISRLGYSDGVDTAYGLIIATVFFFVFAFGVKLCYLAMRSRYPRLERSPSDGTC